MRFITYTLCSLIMGCSAPADHRDTTVDPECEMVFGATGNQFLGCLSGPFVNQISK